MVDRIITYAVGIICGLVLFSACCNDDDAAQRNGIVRIGIAWRGDSMAITYTSTLQSVREAGAIPVPLSATSAPL